VTTSDRAVVHRFICGGCGKVTYGEIDGQLPNGYHLSVRWGYYPSTFNLGEIYACRDTCVAKALKNAKKGSPQ
jgi:hypothetical protein